MDKREAITASNLGPVVSLLTWIMAASIITAVGIKFTLSSLVLKRRNREDIALFLAMAFSIGFSIAMSFAAQNGIGRHENSLSPRQLESLQKAVYSADILLILVLSSVQASILVFLHDITPNSRHTVSIKYMADFTTLFSVSSFVAVFQCSSPRVWKMLGSQCIDRLSFWEVFVGVNLVAETILISFPIMMPRSKKVTVIGGFATRLLVVGAFAAQFHEAQELKSQLSDRTFHSWKFLLTMVFVQGFSIITVCIPYIRNMLLSMESGMIQTGHFRLPSRRGTETEVVLQPITVTHTITKRFVNEGAKLHLIA
ncbi:uncharacterized protein F4822DRAFT_164400 [Hypoxylon trugodes]|uniref:uncharacterized protein n=1 Tax=Hypoxylon trugodes TaxID=326681 RepID=UPI0021941730|nr:uncharacterized protein F4822DRAFT_164400 [Hypoxylon trugodes]KAI1390833.1 hypothetical protein F4822DRAFT_164400 [Hypoxylon trugodes]